MTDPQILTMAIAIVFPLSMLIYSNSRITDAKDTLRTSLGEVKETLRAEMRAMQAELTASLSRIENKLDHVVETQATHSERLEGLERK